MPDFGNTTFGFTNNNQQYGFEPTVTFDTLII